MARAPSLPLTSFGRRDGRRRDILDKQLGRSGEGKPETNGLPCSRPRARHLKRTGAPCSFAAGQLVQHPEAIAKLDKHRLVADMDPHEE
jgi:hypothetical protein